MSAITSLVFFWSLAALAALIGLCSVLMAVMRVGFADQRSGFRDLREGARTVGGSVILVFAGLMMGVLLMLPQ